MFKTIREVTVGKKVLRLGRDGSRFEGVVLIGPSVAARIDGATEEEVWRRLHDEVARASPKYFGFSGARAHFLKFFPEGFRSARYRQKERDYKLAAKAKLDSTVPLDKATTGRGFGESVLSVFHATNLLSPYEKMRLRDLLRGPEADNFVQAAARFANGDIRQGLVDMASLLKPHDNAKWPVATYLSFLWRPDKQMFLKPIVTKDFAERVGHPFAANYSPRLDGEVYLSLLDLASTTEAQLTELNPEDRIDVQSFIWVVGEYDTETELPSD